jgi:excisionase family DNA binding protein
LESGERITLQEAAERLAVHYMTAYRYVRTGRLPARQEGARWTVATADVELLRRHGGRRARGSGRPASKERLGDRLVAGDEAGAWSVIEAALGSGMDPAEVHLELLAPALRDIGDRWADGDLSVADEHRASTVAARLVGRLGPLFARRGRKRGTVVLGSVAGEAHALPSAMLADILRGARFEVVDLGANTPADSFAAAIRGVDRLVAVLLAATGPGHERAVAAAVRAVRAACPGAPILVGGAAIEDGEAATRLGADGWSGRDARDAAAAVEGLLERR